MEHGEDMRQDLAPDTLVQALAHADPVQAARLLARVPGDWFSPAFRDHLAPACMVRATAGDTQAIVIQALAERGLALVAAASFPEHLVMAAHVGQQGSPLGVRALHGVWVRAIHAPELFRALADTVGTHALAHHNRGAWEELAALDAAQKVRPDRLRLAARHARTAHQVQWALGHAPGSPWTECAEVALGWLGRAWSCDPAAAVLESPELAAAAAQVLLEQLPWGQPEVARAVGQALDHPASPMRQILEHGERCHPVTRLRVLAGCHQLAEVLEARGVALQCSSQAFARALVDNGARFAPARSGPRP